MIMSDSHVDPEEREVPSLNEQMTHDKLNGRIEMLRFMVAAFTIVAILIFASSVLQVISAATAGTLFENDASTVFYWTWGVIAFLVGTRTYCTLLYQDLIVQRRGGLPTLPSSTKHD
jgi:hypothetical protein